MKLIEDVRAYWDQRPCNIRHSQCPVGTKEYFDEVEKRKFFVEPHLVTFADFPSVKGKKVLEIGCGIGTATIQFARAGASKVVAVDLSEKSLELAKKRAEIYGFSDIIQFYHGNAEELSSIIPKESFDLIFSFGVIHHTPFPGKILKEMAAYTDSNSVVKVMVYYRFSWKSFWIFLKYGQFRFWKWDELIARYSEAQTGCPITYTYSKREIGELFDNAGFDVVDFDVNHIFPYRISDYVHYKYTKACYFKWMPLKLFRFLEKKLGWHLCVTAVKR